MIADVLLALWRRRAKPGCAERAGADAYHNVARSRRHRDALS